MSQCQMCGFEEIDGKKHYRQCLVGDLERENKELRECLKASELFRKAYRKGKLELYAMGGEITKAAMECLPCSEGPLERASDKLINGGKQ